MPTNANCLIVLTVLLLASSLQFIDAASCAGCVDLDELNFDKTIAHFPYALVKFDIAFPYGEKHEAFNEFSKAAHQVTDELLIATVGIKDYGEMENKQLGERFNVDDKSFPGIFLFKAGVTEYVQLPAHLDVTLDNLKKFINEHTNFYIGRDGCIKEFNDLVLGYANLEDDVQLELLAIAEKKTAAVEQEADKANAKWYLTFMHKINTQGYAFVEDETKRLLRLRAGKVTAAKKTELSHRLNILEAFRITKLTKATNQKHEEQQKQQEQQDELKVKTVEQEEKQEELRVKDEEDQKVKDEQQKQQEEQQMEQQAEQQEEQKDEL